jgi:hypothetical protein
VLCAVTIPPADLRSLNLYYYAVCGHMCMSCVCLVFMSVGDLLQQIIDRQEHQTHTDDIHMWPHTA